MAFFEVFGFFSESVDRRFIGPDYNSYKGWDTNILNISGYFLGPIVGVSRIIWGLGDIKISKYDKELRNPQSIFRKAVPYKVVRGAVECCLIFGLFLFLIDLVATLYKYIYVRFFSEKSSEFDIDVNSQKFTCDKDPDLPDSTPDDDEFTPYSSEWYTT